MRRNYFDSGTGTIKKRDIISDKKVEKEPVFNEPNYMKKQEIDACLNCPLPNCRGYCNLLKEIDYNEE